MTRAPRRLSSAQRVSRRLSSAQRVARRLSSAQRVSKPRRERSVSESLLSIVLGLEAFLVFFVTLAAFGLKVLEPAPAFIGGAALIIALILVAGIVRYRWGVWLGWLLQGALVATGILLPIMFVIAAGFVGIWIYCFIKGGQLDRAKAAHFANRPEETE